MSEIAMLPDTPTREDIDAFVRFLMSQEQAGHGVEVLTWHHFAEGQAARTIVVEAGTWVVGVEHLHEHLCISSGDITVWTVGGCKRLNGYHVLTSLPGAQRVGFAHADTWWTTVHLNADNCRDVAELERRCFATPEMLQGNRHALPPPPSMLEVQ